MSAIKIFVLGGLLLQYAASVVGQPKKERLIVDNNRKFFYSREDGITKSYIDHFGDQFILPELKTIDGKVISPEFLKGKTVVYNFWFVACKPCIAEIPALNKLVEKHQSDSVIFIGVTFDNESRIVEFLNHNKFSFQIASLPQSEIDKVKKFSYYPFTVIVNKEGVLSYAFFGRITGKDPIEELFQLLDRKIKESTIN